MPATQNNRGSARGDAANVPPGWPPRRRAKNDAARSFSGVVS